jgi:hypothetical protein
VLAALDSGFRRNDDEAEGGRAQLRQKRGKEMKPLCGAAVLASPRLMLSLGRGKRVKIGGSAVHRCLPVIMLAAGLSACVSSGGGSDPRIHYAQFDAEPPQGNRITVCHAYTCKMQTPYTFSRADIAEIAAVMKRAERADTPAEERRGVAYAIAHIDVKIGNKLGIKDRAGMQFTASGDPAQLDCVDVSTNTTSYLLVMQSNGLLKYHTVQGTMSKENLAKGMVQLNPVKYWPHFSAILQDKTTGQKWAVDRWPFDQGENPAVQKVEDWYIPDDGSDPTKPRPAQTQVN